MRNPPSRERARISTVAFTAAVLALLCEPVVRTQLHGKGGEDGAAALSVPVVLEPPPVTWDIPIHRTPDVERWISFYSGRGRVYFETWLNRMTRYEGLIRSELRRRGMPEDLVYVALIESGFEPLALSPAEALGMWQFMAGTAREHGLLVNRYVDERLDPIRSTTAAVDFLEDLYERFGSWYLAAAAYNAGPNRVQKTLNRHAPGQPLTEDLFWKIKEHLPQETQQHVPRLIAAAVLGKEPERFGFRPVLREPMSYEEIYAPGETSLSAVAEAAGASEDEVLELNPHLFREMSPPGLLYPVRIPRGASQQVLAALSRPQLPVAPTTMAAAE